MVWERDHEAPRYVVFSTPLLLRPSQAQVPFSAAPTKQIDTTVCIYARINQCSQWNVLFANYGLKMIIS